MREQGLLFGGMEISLDLDHANPCVRAYGFGPDGKLCKTCSKLFYHARGKRYYKCKLRTYSHGKGTDHRVRWTACGMYQEAESNEPPSEGQEEGPPQEAPGPPAQGQGRQV